MSWIDEAIDWLGDFANPAIDLVMKYWYWILGLPILFISYLILRGRGYFQ